MARKKTTPEEEMNQNPATEVVPMQEAGSLETIQQPNGEIPSEPELGADSSAVEQQPDNAEPESEPQSDNPLSMENPQPMAEGLPLQEGLPAECYEVDLSEKPEAPAPVPDKDEDDWGFQEEIKEAEPAPVQEVPKSPAKSDRQKFFELKFNELDRNLTPEERQEWNSIYASYRGRSALSGTVIGVDPLSVFVRNPKTGAMEKQTMFCAIVVPYRVRVVIPASEMWEQGQERPDYVMQNIVGSVIDYIIIKVDRESNFAIGSRRLANRSQRYFFAHREDLHRVGARIKCRLLAVGPRRCLAECYGHDLDITQREMRYVSIPDLRNEYHPGMELECIVKVYDPDKDELVISIKDTEVNPFYGAQQRHPVGARRLAVIAGKYGGGVFCNLPDGVTCMCNYSYQHEDSDFMVGENVMLLVQRYEEEKLQMYGKIMSKW